MGVMKTLDIELQDLDAEVDLTNSEDIFDLVVDTHLANKPLSRLMLLHIANSMIYDKSFKWLMHNSEFVDCWDWHGANCG